MNQNIIDKSQKLIQGVSLDFVRNMYHSISWDFKLIGIVGQRGVGKTTLLLQYLKIQKKKPSLYFSADNINLIDIGLYNFVERMYLENGISLFGIDEIHKYKNWNQELKNLYDDFPNMQIIFSGSSSIDLIKGKYDLSRRVLLYKMPGLSFQEYLCFTQKDKKFQSYTFTQIMNNTENIVSEIYSVLGDAIISEFYKYLQIGYYPFTGESIQLQDFSSKLLAILDKLIYEDIANFYSLDTLNLEKIKKIIVFFALAKPGDLSINSLKNKLSLSFDTTAKYLQILSEVGIIKSLYAEGNISKSIRKAEKIFIDNSNLIYAISEEVGREVEKGTIREVFFVNQFSKYLFYSDIGDFSMLSNNIKYYFEIGGQNKKRKQISDRENAFIISDGVIFPTPGKIPLWLFGFMER